MVVISPHLDDAVFGCGTWLAAHPGCTVITLFAGMPRDAGLSTDWDRRCGFHDAAQAVPARRQEDARALALLGARPVWLDLADNQYGASPTPEQAAAELAVWLDEFKPGVVLLPLGMFHADHLLAHEAAALALAGRPAVQALAYEDGLYRDRQGLLQQRLAALLQAGVCATPHPGPDAARWSSAKQEALLAYASQLRALGTPSPGDLLEPERYWALSGGAFDGVFGEAAVHEADSLQAVDTPAS